VADVSLARETLTHTCPPGGENFTALSRMFATTKLAAAGARIGDFYDETPFLQAFDSHRAACLSSSIRRIRTVAVQLLLTAACGQFLALGLVRIGDENHLL